jgi:hypothetical protein
MKTKLFSISVLILLGMTIAGCSDATSHTRGVYMLLDTSGTYAKELGKAQAIINYLLGTLNPGDSLAVARIDTGSFSEKDIVSKVTFDNRPSVANGQKRAFKESIDQFVSSVSASQYTDIAGGILQAVEYLNETGAGKRHILIFSDLEQDLVVGYVRDFAIEMDGIHVVALNVTKLRSDNVDPRKYLERLAEWKAKVETGGGAFRVVNDLERLDSILSE